MVDLPAGTISWTSVQSTWSVRRNLNEADNNSSTTLYLADVNDTSQSHEVVQSTLPSWCSFYGMILYMYLLSIGMGNMICEMILCGLQ